MRVIQGLQVFIQNRVITRVLARRGDVKPPSLLRLLSIIPVLQRLPARVVGLGVRREHVSAAVLRP
jgi:hypothetical protein